MFTKNVENLDFKVTGLDEFVPLLDNLKEQDNLFKTFKGYSFFRKYIFTSRINDRKKEYNPLDIKDPREAQAIIKEFDYQYDIVSFAVDKNEIVGYIYFMWDKLTTDKLWAYHGISIETKSNWRQKGIATKILQNVHNSNMFENKIIKLYDFEPKHVEILKPKIISIFNSDKYFLEIGR